METTEEEIKKESAWEGMNREERQEVLDQYQDMEIGPSDDDTWFKRAHGDEKDAAPGSPQTWIFFLAFDFNAVWQR